MVEYQLTMALHSAIRMAFPPADAVAIPIGGKDVAGNVPLTTSVVVSIGVLLRRLFLGNINYIHRRVFQSRRRIQRCRQGWSGDGQTDPDHYKARYHLLHTEILSLKSNVDSP